MRSIRVGGAKKERHDENRVFLFYLCPGTQRRLTASGQQHFVQSKNITPIYAGKYVYALLGVDLLLRNLL